MVPDSDIKVLVGNKHLPAVFKGSQTPGVSYGLIPQKRAVICVKGDDAIVGRDKQTSILI